MKKIFLLLCLTLVSCTSDEPAKNKGSNDSVVANQMKKIGDSINGLFSYTWDRDHDLTESEKADFVQIVSNLKNNFHNIKSIESSETDEVGFQLILNDQNKLLTEIENNLNNDKFDYARWQLRGVTHNCFACHSRIPSLSDKIERNLKINGTSFEARLTEVEFLVASRQFETAENKLYNLAEQLSVKDDRKGLALDSIKLLVLLQLRVTNDLKEATAKLEDLIAKSSFDAETNSLVKYWAEQLKVIAETRKRKFTLDSIEGILDDLEKYRTEEENDHDLVSSIYASSLLHQLQYVNESNLDHQKLLALLGISYSRITIPSMQALSMPYLEQCIRNTPQTKWSNICFIHWKSIFDFNHTGSGGKKLEKAEEDKVNELNALAN